MTSEDIADKVKKEVLDTYPQDGINIVIPAPDDYAFQLTSTSNELSALHESNFTGMSILDLNECESLLKQRYNISENSTLIVLKYEKLTNIGSEKSIQYEIYNPNDFSLLNLSICQNTDIDIAIPIDFEKEIENLYYSLKEEGYDLFDRNSRFYLDICTPFQAENGADVLLADRLHYFFSKVMNLTICPSNCQFSFFSIENKYLSCQCDIDNDSIDLVNREKYIGKLLYNLSDYKLRYTSYKTMKCYKLVFSLKHFIKNFGSIILLFLLIAYISFFIYFLIKDISPLKTAISKIIFDDNNVDNKVTPKVSPFFDIRPSDTKSAKTTKSKKSAKTTKSTKSTKSSRSKFKQKKALSTKGDNPPRRSLKNTLKINFGNKDRLVENKILAFNMRKTNNLNSDNNNNNLITNQIKESIIKEEEVVETKTNNITTNIIKKTYDNNNNNEKTIKIDATGTRSFYINIGSKMKLKPKKDNSDGDVKSERTRKNKPRKVKFKEVLESSSSMIEDHMPVKEEVILDDYELNHLGYLAAVKLDKRNCCKMYYSLLKRDQNIMFTCFAFNDYNLFYVKMAKFIFVIANLMAMNAFLFADKSFHKLFISGVHYYFSYQVLQISLSVIITYVAEVILCFLTFTDKYIYEIKTFHKNENNTNKIFKILKFVRNKLIVFYVVDLTILLFYWYFISAFCAVYPATQKFYLLDCTISFLAFSIIPFIVYAVMTLIRFISLKDVNKKRFKCLYKVSQTFPLF